jgi:glycosyltransferase involved in cell wall biosynthesis
MRCLKGMQGDDVTFPMMHLHGREDSGDTVIAGSRVHPSPQVSVVIPAYNPKWLDAALDSVRHQTFKSWELIVVDDGSPEPVRPSVVDDVVLIRQRNGGPGGARNTGVRHARGSLVAFLDADDRWRPDKLERQVALHDAHPDLVMSCTGLTVTDGEHVKAAGKLATDRLKLKGDRVPYSHLFYENCIVCSSVMLKRDAFQRTPGMKAHKRMGEDYGLWLRVGMLGPVGYLSEPLLERRQHPDSLMFETKRDGSWFAQEREIYEEILAQNPELQNEPFVRRALARLDFQGAWSHIERREWSEARQALLRSLSYTPLRPKAWLDLARTFLHVGPVRRLNE